jgi:hypothetical protein
MLKELKGDLMVEMHFVGFTLMLMITGKLIILLITCHLESHILKS